MRLNEIDEYLDRVAEELFEGTRFVGEHAFLQDIGDLEAQLSMNFGYFNIRGFKSSNFVYGSALGRYRKGLQEIISNYMSDVTVDPEGALRTAKEAFEALCLSTYRDSYRAGVMRAGNPKGIEYVLTEAEEDAIKKIVESETDFFVRRITNMTEAQKKLVSERFAMSSKALFFNGLVAGSAPSQQFKWELGSVATRHCEDCVELAANSPYTKETLPTVPRAGDTRCLFRCHCSLVPLGGAGVDSGIAEPVGEDRYTVSVSSNIEGVERTIVVGPAREELSNLYERLNRVRAELEFATDENLRKFLIKQKTNITKDIINRADALGLRVVPLWGLKDIKTLTATFKAKGYKLVDSIGELATGMEVYFVSGTLLRVGTVEQVSGQSVALRAGNQIYRFLGLGRLLGFIRG